MEGYRNVNKRIKRKKKDSSAHFDYDFTKKIMKLADMDPYYAIESIEKYIDMYPDDYNLQTTYVSLLITVGEFEKAEKNNKEVKKKILNNNSLSYVDNGKKIKRILSNITYNEFRIISNSGYYKEAYDFLLRNKETIENKEFKDKSINYSIMTYFQTRIFDGIKRDDYQNYVCKQMVEYSEEDFFEHIKRHIKGTTSDIVSESLFFEEVDLRKVYHEIMKYIPSDKALYRGFVDKTYYFKYDSCGIVGSEIADYFKIITFGDDKGVITMCPVKNGEYLPHIDINYLKEDENVKTKRLSQIEKFNKRYEKK